MKTPASNNNNNNIDNIIFNPRIGYGKHVYYVNVKKKTLATNQKPIICDNC